MVASVMCFAVMDLCVKWLNYYPFGEVFFARFFFGLIPIFLIIPRDRWKDFYKTSRPGLHAFRAIAGATAFICIFFGLRNLPLADVVSPYICRSNFRYNCFNFNFIRKSWSQKMVSSFYRFFRYASNSSACICTIKLLLFITNTFLHFFFRCGYKCKGFIKN